MAGGFLTILAGACLADIERTVRYIELNPIKARMPGQNWNFFTAYNGWPFHKRRQ